MFQNGILLANETTDDSFTAFSSQMTGWGFPEFIQELPPSSIINVDVSGEYHQEWTRLASLTRKKELIDSI